MSDTAPQPTAPQPTKEIQVHEGGFGKGAHVITITVPNEPSKTQPQGESEKK